MERITLVTVCKRCEGKGWHYKRPHDVECQERVICKLCKETGINPDRIFTVNPESVQSIRLAIKERCTGDGWKNVVPCTGYTRHYTMCPACEWTGLNAEARERLFQNYDPDHIKRIMRVHMKWPGMELGMDRERLGSFRPGILKSAGCDVCDCYGFVHGPCTRCLGSIRRLNDYKVLPDGIIQEDTKGAELKRFSTFLLENEIRFTEQPFSKHS